MTATSILGLDRQGAVLEGRGEPELSGACIHLGVRRTRPGARVIMVGPVVRNIPIKKLILPLSQHTHTPYATALGCLENPRLEMVHQNTCRFLGRCAWDTGYQPATMIEEGERLGQVLGDKDILFMCHHGTLVSPGQIGRVSVSILSFLSGRGSQGRE